jgi:hypothetical protein
MRVLFATLAIVTGLVGFVFILQGGNHPSKYREVLSDSVSAVQVTQVYTEAMYKIVVGIGIVSIAVLVAVIGILFHASKPLNPNPPSTDNLES